MIDTDKLWIKSMEWFSKYWGCHQMPERSFFINKYQLPICARCTGIIIGEIISTIMFFIFSMPIYIYILFTFPMIIDGLIQLKTTYESTNIKRFITGFLFGYGMVSFIFSLLILLIKNFLVQIF